ncbi:MAG: glycosyltransferase family 4 protein [Solirubrobacteraceae bacterium]
MARRPRAAIVRQTYDYEPQLQREAEALVAAGYDVEMICMRNPERPWRATVNGVRVVSLPAVRTRAGKLGYLADYAWFFAVAALRLTAGHVRRPYAVIQINTMPDFLVFAAVVPKLLGARVYAYMHEPAPELAETLYGSGRMSRVLAWVEQRSLAFADHAFAVTEAMKRRYVERGARADRITVVLNGVDASVRMRGWAPSPGERPTHFTVMCHGLVEDRYGQDTIVEAARLLRDQLPDLRVVLTGRGTGVEHVRGLIDRYGLNDVVRFEGWVSHQRLNDLLHGADAGIVAQKASPYSHLVSTNKMVDFWLFGLPVIASRLDATAELYADDVLEYFEPGDPADLARAIRRLHDNVDRRAALAASGRTANERNGWAVQREAYLQPFVAERAS